jgi:hypothetical protein
LLFELWRFVLGKSASMSEQSIALGQEFGSRESDPADPIVANLQQSAKLANGGAAGSEKATASRPERFRLLTNHRR